jgi:DHA2 family multidrug resistance protein
MVILDSTVINVAFPTLREEFHASLTDSQWVISLYVVALGISTPLAGFLADRFGIKRIYITGLALFVLGSFLCGVSPQLGLLIAARALQGFGGGIALPLGTALLFGAFTVEEQGLAFGIFGIALVVAPTLGPILGGWLVDNNLWRWIFFINLPIGILGVILATAFLREGSIQRKRFDLLGLLTSAVGFGAALYAASIAATEGWTSQRVLIFFAIGGVGLLAFAIVELFIAKDPLLNLRLFAKPIFLIGTLIGYVSVLALFGAEFLLPLYLQSLRGKTALETGVIVLPLAIASGIIAPFAGKLYDKFGARPLMVVGFGLLLINTWQFAQLDATTPIAWILFLLVLRGIALGLTVQTTLVASLSVVPGPEIARASSLSNATRQVVQSIGVAVLATVLTTTLSPQIQAFENQAQSAILAASAAHFGLCTATNLPTVGAPDTGSTSTGGPPPGVTGQPSGQGGDPAALLRQACDESLHGFENAYQLTFYFAIVALILGALLPGWPLKWAGRQSPGARNELVREQVSSIH